MTAPTVEIHVKGGVAYVVRKDAGVRVILRDFDNDGRHGNPARYGVTVVIAEREPTSYLHRKSPSPRTLLRRLVPPRTETSGNGG